MITLFLFAEVKAQCNSAFYDGFESGSYSPTWTAGTGTNTRTVTTSAPAVGSYCLEQNGSSGHYQGTSTSFAPQQPSYVSWWAKSNNVTNATAYFVIGDANCGNGNNGIMFCYMYQGTFRFAGSTSLTPSCAANTWYFFELRNINFTTQTFDIWIDGNLVAANATFRNSATEMSRIHIYNFQAGTGWWDDVVVGGVQLNISASGNDALCAGDSTGSAAVTVNSGTPGYNYLWSTGSTSASISGLAAGSYSVVVTDTNGCLDSATVAISEPTQITDSVAITDALCNGNADGLAMVSASGGTPGYTYLWSTGDTTGMVSGLAAGTYTVMITDSAGCMVTDSVMVGEPAAITDSVNIMNPSCNGDTNGMATLSVSGGTPGYTYLWSTGDSSTSISNLTAGTYSFIVTDSNGCTLMDSLMVMDPAVLTSSLAASDVNCFEGTDGAITATPGGGTPGYTYMWSNGDTSMMLSGVGAGSYMVTITDNNGCMTMDSASVAEPASAVTGSASVTNETTGQSNGAIDYTATGGTPPYTFSWDNGATTEDLTGLAGGTYLVTVTDGNGCTFMDTVVVETVVGFFEPANGPDVTVFPNPANQQLNVNISGAQGDVTLYIVALDGRVIREARLTAATSQREALQVGDLAQGMYMLRISDEKGTSMVRFTKQ